MRSYRSHDQPRLFWAKSALTLGILSFLPLLGAALALLAFLSAAVGGILHARKPSRYGGRPLLWIGASLAVLGLAAFAGEMTLFLRWKREQAEAQKVAVSRHRLGEWAWAVEHYRIETGFYPVVSGAAEAEKELAPLDPTLPKEDAWGRPFTYTSDGLLCTVSANPPAGSPDAHPLLRYEGTFPALPPEPPAIGPPAPWPPVSPEHGAAEPDSPTEEPRPE